MTAQQQQQRRIVEPQSHEFSAYWHTNEHGLKPWFAADAVAKKHGGAVSTTFDALGHTWEATLYTRDGGNLVPPRNGQTPAGTTVEHETIREFQINVEAVDCEIISASFHLTPRWKNQKGKTKTGATTSITVPDDLVSHNDAVAVDINGSNIAFNQYGELLRAAADAVDINSRYFAESERHRTSNVQDIARYVRVHRDQSGPIHSRTGPIAQLSYLLDDDRSGYRKFVQDDNDELGRKMPGYYNTATLGPRRVAEVFPDHQLPVEVKHYYYNRNAKDRPESDPLAHPKLEVSYQTKRWDGTLRYDNEALEKATKELDEWIYSVVEESGLDVRAGGGTYVEDDCFKPENKLTDANVVNLDLVTIRHEQETIVNKQLVTATPTQKETLNVLMADGGTVSPKDIADETGRHVNTVYDALGDMNDLVKHVYGEVSIESTYLSELVADALESAEREVARATNAAAEAVNAANRGLDEKTSAWIAWRERYGINISALESDDSGTVDLGRVDSVREAREILRSGLDLWEAMKKEPVNFRGATVKYETEEKETFNYLPDKTRSVRHRTTAWKLIAGR